MNAKRKQAIDSGVANAIDTVCIDKEMTAEQAFAQLESVVADGLSCYGLSDIVTAEESAYAKTCWPLNR